MAVAKAALLEPLTESTMAVNQSALVIGGGVPAWRRPRTCPARDIIRF